MCDSNYMAFKKGKMMGTVKRSVVARVWGKGRINRQSTVDFQGRETILYNIVKVDICYSLVQIHRMGNTKSEP